jgi:hypothetical protein
VAWRGTTPLPMIRSRAVRGRPGTPVTRCGMPIIHSANAAASRVRPPGPGPLRPSFFCRSRRASEDSTDSPSLNAPAIGVGSSRKPSPGSRG